MIPPLEDVVRRLAQSRPGLTLVHFEEAAIPLFRLTLDAVVQRHKPIPPIEEFVLRSAAAGLDSVETISGFLGLEGTLIESAVATHWHLDDLDYSTPPGDATARIQLSPKGKVALIELQTITPERMELAVDFDRLTWQVARIATPAPLRPRDIKDLGVRELPAQLARRPKVDELPIEQLSRLVAAVGGARTSEVDLLAIRNVVRAERIYELGALLVYAGESDGEIETAIAIDGRISPAHEVALGGLGGLARLSISLDSQPAEALPLNATLRAQLASDERVAELQRRLVTAEERLERVRAATTGVPEESTEVATNLASSENELEQEIQEAKQELESIAVRRVQVYEHPIHLKEARSRARKRLLIISPWITAAVVNRDFLSDLERLCNRGVAVHIGYGIDDKKPQYPQDRDAVRRLEALASQHENFVLKRLGYTHAKVLIWDDTWITTSFNWLSFKGDPKKTFRQEEGVLVGVKGEVDAMYRQYSEEIDQAGS